MALEIGEPTGTCPDCGTSLVRHVDLSESVPEAHEECPFCQ